MLRIRCPGPFIHGRGDPGGRPAQVCRHVALVLSFANKVYECDDLPPLVEWREWQQHAATPAIPQKHHCEERSDEESEIRQHISRTVTASKGHHLY